MIRRLNPKNGPRTYGYARVSTDGQSVGIRIILADAFKPQLGDAADFQPTHAAKRSGQDTIGMPGNEVAGNDAPIE